MGSISGRCENTTGPLNGKSATRKSCHTSRGRATCCLCSAIRLRPTVQPLAGIGVFSDSIWDGRGEPAATCGQALI